MTPVESKGVQDDAPASATARVNSTPAICCVYKYAHILIPVFSMIELPARRLVLALVVGVPAVPMRLCVGVGGADAVLTASVVARGRQINIPNERDAVGEEDLPRHRHEAEVDDLRWDPQLPIGAHGGPPLVLRLAQRRGLALERMQRHHKCRYEAWRE